MKSKGEGSFCLVDLGSKEGGGGLVQILGVASHSCWKLFYIYGGILTNFKVCLLL